MTGLTIIGLWAVGALFAWALVAGATRGEPDDDGAVEHFEDYFLPEEVAMDGTEKEEEKW